MTMNQTENQTGPDQDALLEGAIAAGACAIFIHFCSAYLTRKYGARTTAKFWAASLISQALGVGILIAGVAWNPLYNLLLASDGLSEIWLYGAILLVVAPYPIVYILAAKESKYRRKTRGPLAPRIIADLRHLFPRTFG